MSDRESNGTSAKPESTSTRNGKPGSSSRSTRTRTRGTGAGTGTKSGTGSGSRSKSPQPAAEEPAEQPAPKKPGAAQVLRSAQDTLEALTGLESESVSSVIRGDDGGWTLHVEVVELRRLPDSTSMLGSYEVTLDEDGELTGYRRLHRYERGKADPK
ncbi:gas vesicle protein [Streptomyces sp. NBC_01775]|uniref:gas vesicle protein GvpO n=1 Tax=Streptomyces sp. NBC_01775 TaxID=2975939 RepID=UPI002DD911FB|nr:gas vesicle protein [Streptomyces sp. NBC_01775]WSB80235.1 gas vesicle protein [Streptomyces sp. NBC_01775]